MQIMLFLAIPLFSDINLTLHIFVHFCLIFRSEYVFNFDNTFELHNDIDVLKKMGLDCGLHSGTYTDEDVKTAKSMLPKALGNTLEGMQRLLLGKYMYIVPN